MPERQRELLQSISAYLRHRDRVLSDWGYEKTVARTQGLKVLFAGESGTGKTMAAQVLAAELGLEIFRVDLATTVSKYIGETEKNLDRIFGAAEGSNAILFFDEADALFGKRSEVGDSHDRYANIEVAYLLQKMEGYPGAVILATNFRRNIDDAFVRRLDFVIDFPFPEADDRRRIWDRVLPEEAPRADDVDLDFLSREVQALRRRDPQLLAGRRLPGRRRRRGDLDAPPRARRRAGVRQAGPAHARGRLRALPRRDPRGRRPSERRVTGYSVHVSMAAALCALACAPGRVTIDERAGTYRGVGLLDTRREVERRLGRARVTKDGPFEPLNMDFYDAMLPTSSGYPANHKTNAIWRFTSTRRSTAYDGKAFTFVVTARDAVTKQRVGVGNTLEEVRAKYADVAVRDREQGRGVAGRIRTAPGASRQVGRVVRARSGAQRGTVAQAAASDRRARPRQPAAPPRRPRRSRSPARRSSTATRRARAR